MRRVWLVVLVGLMVACGQPSEAPPTSELALTPDLTTTTAAVAATTTVVESTTTTIAEPVDVCRRGEKWVPGTTYVAECFLVPVVFDPVEEGWGSLGGDESWLKVRWRDSGDQEFRVRIALIAYWHSDTPTEVVDRITSRELISEVSERMVVNVGGASGLVVDVEGAAEPGGELAAPDGVPCTPEDRPVWFPNINFGHTLVEAGSFEVIGIGACDLARIWVLEAEGSSVTIVGGTGDPDRHDEAVAKIEELFEGMSFETEGP